MTPELEKEFVPYIESLQLKELGFDEPCLAYWDDDKVFELNPDFLKGSEMDRTWLTAPTFSQAFRWFREKKLSDSCICLYHSRDDGGIYYYYVINHDYGVEETTYYKEGFFSYEAAELACLRKLIEIVKQKQ